VLTYGVHNQVQYDLRDHQPPIKESFLLIDSFVLNLNKLRDTLVQVKMNTIDAAYSRMIGFLFDSYNGVFYTIGHVISSENRLQNSNINMLLRIEIGLETRVEMHMTSVYNLMDLVGDIGGVLEIFFIIFSIFLVPLSEFGYELKALKMLYQVKS
jgi:hypothetical protein